MAGEKAEGQGAQQGGIVRLTRRNEPLIEREGFFWPPQLERALEGEADERLGCCGFWRNRIPEL